MRDINKWLDKIVRHFKGKYYQVMYLAQHTETGEMMVVYRALYGNFRIYVRPLDMFMSACTPEQYDKYRQLYRFELDDTYTTNQQ